MVLSPLKKSNTKGVFNIDLVRYELMHLEECIIVLSALSDIEAMLPKLHCLFRVVGVC